MRARLAVAASLAVAAVALAADAGDVSVRVMDASKRPVKDAPVVVRVKAWPGGKFQLTDRDATSDAKGRAAFDAVVPPDTRYGVWASVVSPGWTLTSRYVWSPKPAAAEPVELTVAPAHPLKLRFVDDAGKPVEGVRWFPSMRAAADGTRHTVATGARDAIVATSGRGGVSDLRAFLAGEWASVDVQFPGGPWETRHLLVPAAKDAVVDVPRTAPATPDRELAAGGDARKRVFLTGPKAGDREPPQGWGLVLVLPGGDGSDGFREWVRERYDSWVDAGWVWAQLVAPKWTPEQRIVWPTAAARAEGMQFTTEEFVAAAVEEAARQVKIDRRRVLTVSWSSSGPACYRIASLADTPVTGSLVAMSVWKPDQMEPLANAKTRPFFVLHAPDDDRCPFADAERARDTLRKAGAKVEFAAYEGGHGWAGTSEDEARRGLRWLAERVK